MKTFLAYIVVLTIVAILVRLISRDCKRAAEVTSFWGIYEVFSWIYDDLLWFIIVAWLGNLTGSIICSVGAFIINLNLLRWYRKNGKDLVGADILETIKAKGRGWSEKVSNYPRWYIKWTVYLPIYLLAKLFEVVIWCLNKNDLLAFLILSIGKDSFITTAFLRHGRSGKLEAGDYALFITSTIVSVVSWSLWMIVGVQIVKTAWKAMFG